MAVLGIEIEICQEQNPTVMIILFHKGNFLSFLDNVFKEMLIYFSRTELVFSA